MTKETHKTGGLFLSTILILHNFSKLINNVNNIPFAIIILSAFFYFAVIGSYFPDIDLKSSYISKRYPLLWNVLGKNTEHRSFTHSTICVILIIIFSLYLYKVSDNNILLKAMTDGFITGYMSHIFLDIFNSQGVRLLWPLKIKIKFSNILAGSSMEKTINTALKILTVLLILKEVLHMKMFLS